MKFDVQENRLNHHGHIYADSVAGRAVYLRCCFAVILPNPMQTQDRPYLRHLNHLWFPDPELKMPLALLRGRGYKIGHAYGIFI